MTSVTTTDVEATTTATPTPTSTTTFDELELERYIIFMFVKMPDVEKILAERTGPPIDVVFVYDCNSVDECETYAKSSYRYLTYYLIYDNTWLRDEAYLRLVSMHDNKEYRVSRKDMWWTLCTLECGKREGLVQTHGWDSEHIGH